MAKSENSSDALDSEFDSLDIRRQEKCEELRIVLVGKAGVGKSATGNTITNTKEFETCRSASSITTESKHIRGSFNDIPFVVIDTPGLYDTSEQNSKKHVQEELKRCIKLGAPGFHAIVIVLTLASRFTEEDKSCFLHFFSTFGERFYDYAVVLFTGIDLLLEDGTSFEKYKSGNDVLQKFLTKCGNRSIVFNNKTKDKDVKNRQINSLLTTIMIMNTKNQYYSNELFIKAEEEMKAREKEMKEKFLRRKQETKEKLKKLRRELRVEFNREKQRICEDYKRQIEELKQTKEADIRDAVRRALENERRRRPATTSSTCIIL